VKGHKENPALPDPVAPPPAQKQDKQEKWKATEKQAVWSQKTCTQNRKEFVKPIIKWMKPVFVVVWSRSSDLV
jgi:hypothetical protein